MNLLNETLQALRLNGKSESDVLFCEFEGWFSFDEFKNMADFEYDNGYGGAEIANIKIVGDNWWLERAEYDGSEWWGYKELPQKPLEKANVRDLKFHYSWE